MSEDRLLRSLAKAEDAIFRQGVATLRARERRRSTRVRSDTTKVQNTDALALRCQELDRQGLKRSEIAAEIGRSESRVYQLLRRAKNLQSGARYQVPR